MYSNVVCNRNTLFARTVARTIAALRVQNTEVSVIVIRGILSVGVVMCRPGSHFGPLRCFTLDEKG